jgi:hypothetical protein
MADGLAHQARAEANRARGVRHAQHQAVAQRLDLLAFGVHEQALRNVAKARCDVGRQLVSVNIGHGGVTGEVGEHEGVRVRVKTHHTMVAGSASRGNGSAATPIATVAIVVSDSASRGA